MHIEKIQADKWKVRMPGKYMKATDEGRRQMKMKWKLQDKKRMCKYQYFYNTDINIFVTINTCDL